MIVEIADFRIAAGRQADFETAIHDGLATIVSKSPGYLGATLHRGIENPERYVLQIRWTRLEDHTVTFRQGDAFTAWRALVGPYFAAPPLVEHFDAVDDVGAA